MDRVPCIIPAHTARLETAGEKAVNLRDLGALDLNVPPWFAIHPRSLRETLANAGTAAQLAAQLDRVRMDPGLIPDIASRIRTLFLASRLPMEMKYEVSAARDKLLGGPHFVAVRASATHPDIAPPGTLDGVLYLQDESHLFEAIKTVWASAFSEAALAHRLKHGHDLQRVDLALIVQTMVETRSAGRVQTVDRQNGDLNTLVIHSLWGTGVGLDTAGLPTDTFRVQKTTLRIDATPVAKTQQIILNPTEGNGLMRADVPPAQHDIHSLSNEESTQLARFALDLERAAGRPQEIAFAVSGNGTVNLLRSRSQAGVEEYGPAAGNRQSWSTDVLPESPLGITSPLTFSLAQRTHTVHYLNLAEGTGMRNRAIRRALPPLGAMLGRLRGRLYVNKLQQANFHAEFPGARAAPEFTARLLGLPPHPNPDDPITAPRRPSFAERLAAPYRHLNLRARLAWTLFRLSTRARKTRAEFAKWEADWRSENLKRLRPHELLHLLNEIDGTFLRHDRTPVWAEHLALVHGMNVHRLCRKTTTNPARAAARANRLLANLGPLASLAPVHALQELVETAASNTRLQTHLTNSRAEDLAQHPPEPERFPAFYDGYQQFLDRYGHLSLAGWPVEAPPFRDDPAPLFGILQSLLASRDIEPVLPDPAIPDDAPEHFIELDDDDETEWKSLKLGRVSRKARAALTIRDDMNALRQRVHGLLAQVLREIGEKWHREALIAAPGDIALLTRDEITAFIRGQSASTDLRGLVALRRDELERAERAPVPGTAFETFGVVYHRNHFQSSSELLPPPAFASHGPEPDLRGQPGASGRASGHVHVVLRPAESLPLQGDILVAEHIGTSWLPLLPCLSAILLEHGHPLHPAIVVARHLGIPVIYGIPGLTRVLSTGDRVTCDGDLGAIHREPAESVPFDERISEVLATDASQRKIKKSLL